MPTASASVVTSNSDSPTVVPGGTASSGDVDHTPTGVAFHGPFLNQTLTASADHLPPHRWVAVTIELLVLRSWDGSVPIPDHGKRSPDGPDFVRVGLAGGPTLMFNTFSNTPPDDPGFVDHSKAQSFPSQVPGDSFRPRTGAAERDTLGYNYPWVGTPQPVPMDATYRPRFVVPDDRPDVAVRVTAGGLSILRDESWGVRDVTVRPLAAADVPPPSADTIAKAFAASLDVTGDQQADAFTVLTIGGDATVDWVERNVTPNPIDGDQARRLLDDMTGGDDKVAARDAAGPALFALGPQAEVGLRDLQRAYAGPTAGEVRARCETILERIALDPIADDDLRRVMLATRVLEVIGSPKATALRHRLVGLP